MNGGPSCSSTGISLSQPLTGSVESPAPGVLGIGADPGSAVRMRCSGGRERRLWAPRKAALQALPWLMLPAPGRAAPTSLPAGSHSLRAGRRSRVGGGGAGWLRPRRLGTQGCSTGCGGRPEPQQSPRLPLSFREGAFLQGQRALCLPCEPPHGEAVGDASAWCSGTHTVCVPQVQSTIQFKAPSEMSVSIAWGGEGVAGLRAGRVGPS